MSDHDDAQDYTANGPTDIGFRTGGNNTGIENGVVATGTKVGVRGIGAGVLGSNASTWGVFGESAVGIGVQGQATNDAGVFGSSDNGPGVQGDSISGEGVKASSRSNVGIRGESSSNDGIVGLSSGDRKSGVFGDHTDRTRVTFGVSGRALSPQGAGVFGFSDPGIGVRGNSATNDGIVGLSSGDRKSGVFGDHTDRTRVTFGVSGRSLSPQGGGVFGFSDPGVGVRGNSATNDGIVGLSSGDRKSRVFGDNAKTTGLRLASAEDPNRAREQVCLGSPM